jgi:hypothetical protein
MLIRGIMYYLLYYRCVAGILPTPGEAKAKAMPGRLYIHTRNEIKLINNNNKPLSCPI